jgi:hypothetical protein
MNLPDRFIYICQCLVFVKLVIMLISSITLFILFIYQLSIIDNGSQSQSHGKYSHVRIFFIGGLTISIISLFYVFKRWLFFFETWYTELPRLLPIIWSIYGAILYANNTLFHSTRIKMLLIFLWFIGIGNIFKISFPLDEHNEIRS